MIDFVALALIGIAAGLLAGLLGIGGGVVIVPALTALFMSGGLPLDSAVPMAVATALGSMLLTSASSAWSHWRRGSLDPGVVARLGPAVAVGSFGGAWLAAVLTGQMLARVFAVLISLIALKMLFGLRAAPRAVSPRPRGWYVAGPLVGALSALIGIGGGSFNVPYLTFNGYSTLRAVGNAAACGWPIAVAGSAAFVLAGQGGVDVAWAAGFVYLPGVLVIGVVGALAAPLGTRLAHRIGSVGLARIFGAFLLVVAVRMALQ